MTPAEMAAARLARIAKVSPPVEAPKVRIYELDRGVSLVFWLCAHHLAEKKAAGWEVKGAKDPPHEIACDGCEVAF